MWAAKLAHAAIDSGPFSSGAVRRSWSCHRLAASVLVLGVFFFFYI
jgi:hypothetical protein